MRISELISYQIKSTLVIFHYQAKLLATIEIVRQLALHIIFTPAAPVELKLTALGAIWLLFDGQRDHLSTNTKAFRELPTEWKTVFLIEVIFCTLLFAVGGTVALGFNTPFVLAAASLLLLPIVYEGYKLCCYILADMMQRAQGFGNAWRQQTCPAMQSIQSTIPREALQG